MILLSYSNKLKKDCQKELAKHKIRGEAITYVCIAPNLFPLLQYLLLMEDDVVLHHTYYFVNEVIPYSAQQKIPCTQFRHFKGTAYEEILKRINKLTLSIWKYKAYPFLKSAQLFAYDLPYTNLCIGNRNYSLLADGPNWLTLNMQENSTEYMRQNKKSRSILGLLQKAIFGNLFVHYFGNNRQCTDIYLTEDNISPVLSGKIIHVNSLESLWIASSSLKQNFIKSMFNITDQDLTLLNSRPILFFTQPLVIDCQMTEDEYISLLTPIINSYGEENVIIKPHPRDKFDYNNCFPKALVFTKVINSQLLYLFGVKPKKIATIFSTAIETFPESIECDYYSTNIHPKIKQHFGEMSPNRKVNYCTQYFK